MIKYKNIGYWHIGTNNNILLQRSLHMSYDNDTFERKEKVFSLRELVFRYLVEYEENSFFININYEEMINIIKKPCSENSLDVYEKNNDAYDQLDNEYKNISKYLKDIFRIFDIEIFFDKWKDESKEYEFYESDVDFLCKLLYRYKNCAIWKKIKKVDNRSFDGFVKLYKQEGTIELLNELRFVVNGFTAICKKRYEGEYEKIEDFKNTLHIHTQFRQIKCMEKMKEILFTLPTLSLEEIYNSRAGILLEDYQKFLYLVQDKLSEFIDSVTKFWEQDVEERKKELDELIIWAADDEYAHLLDAAIEHSHILENNDNENYTPSKSRLSNSENRKKNEKSIQQLPKEENEIIMQMIDLLYNGHK